MPRGRRYLLSIELADEGGITPSQLKCLGRARQIEYMQAWFHRFHEDPVHEMPWMDGEYVFPFGGPYDAAAELHAEFSDIVGEDRIKEAAREIESNGTLDWAPSSNHPDYVAAIFQDDEGEEGTREKPPLEARLAELFSLLRRGGPVRFGGEEDRRERRAIRNQLDRLEAALAELRQTPPGIGHNQPPADEEEEAGQPEVSTGEVLVVVGELRAEIDQPTPDAQAVVEKTSRLLRLGGWLRDRVKKQIERTVEEGIGKAAVKAGAAAYVVFKPKIDGIIVQVGEAVVRWVTEITALF